MGGNGIKGPMWDRWQTERPERLRTVGTAPVKIASLRDSKGSAIFDLCPEFSRKTDTSSSFTVMTMNPSMCMFGREMERLFFSWKLKSSFGNPKD